MKQIGIGPGNGVRKNFSGDSMKTCFITGASQGLGRAFSKYFSDQSWYVYAGCFSKEAPLYGPGKVLSGDISREEDVKRIFEEIEALDLLINNARFCPSPRNASMSDSEWWDRNLAVSLKGAYLCSLEAMQRMKVQKNGCIINVSSIRAQIPNDPDRIPYGAAKAGLLSLTTSFAAAGGPFNVRVNALLPGAVETENLMKRISAERYAEVTRTIPLQRMAKMEEICHAAMFLAENTYVTGIALNCSGGALMP